MLISGLTSLDRSAPKVLLHTAEPQLCHIAQSVAEHKELGRYCLHLLADFICTALLREQAGAWPS